MRVAMKNEMKIGAWAKGPTSILIGCTSYFVISAAASRWKRSCAPGSERCSALKRAYTASISGFMRAIFAPFFIV